LSSTPKHILLYDFFEWEKPLFSHLPLLLNQDRSKLSKRQGDVAVEDYRSKGYLKEALINFVALLGWTAGDDREFYYLNELVENFTIERVNKSGAVFNIEKLNWLNAEHLRKKDNSEILHLLKEELSKSKFSNESYSDEYLLKVIDAMKERVSFIKEYIEKSPYFFDAPEEYEEAVVAKRWNDNSSELLIKLTDKFAKLENPVKEDYENALKETAEENETGNGALIHPLRLAVSGMGAGPGVFDIVEILGKDESIKRMKRAADYIRK
ncbi:MAG: glutamate--tRNA ligase, partial [Ignavibacteriales bacterium]